MKLNRKTVLLLMALFLSGILLGAIVVPSYAAAQKEKQVKAIQHNLMIIAGTAGCYMAEKGVAKASFKEMDEGHYLNSVKVVAGESYDAIVVTLETGTISAVMPNGEVVSYSFGGLC